MSNNAFGIDIARRMIECGVPDPEYLTPLICEELRRAAEAVLRGALLRIDHVGVSDKTFLRVETILGMERAVFYIPL